MGAPISPGSVEWNANNTSNVGPIRPGNNEFSTTNLGGRRRKSKKSKKAGRRKSRKFTKRGGGSVSSVGYGYTGTGARGLANVTAYNSNPIPPGGLMAVPQA